MLDGIGFGYLAEPHELRLDTGIWLRVRVAGVAQPGPGEERRLRCDRRSTDLLHGSVPLLPRSSPFHTWPRCAEVAQIPSGAHPLTAGRCASDCLTTRPFPSRWTESSASVARPVTAVEPEGNRTGETRDGSVAYLGWICVDYFDVEQIRPAALRGHPDRDARHSRQLERGMQDDFIDGRHVIRVIADM